MKTHQPLFASLSWFWLITAWAGHALNAHAQTIFDHDANGNRRAQETAGAPTAPFISTMPADQVAMLGQTARFSVVAGGIGPFSYQWFKGAAPISGATSDTLVIANLVAGDFTPSPASATKYSVQVTNAHSTVSSVAAGLYLDSLGSGLPNWWRQQYFASVTSDLWDVSQGTVITSSTAQGAGDLRNMFGGTFSSAEAGTAFFSDAQAGGYVHAVEFECPSIVSVAGYRLALGDDAVNGNRGITEFRLYFYNTTTSSFQLIDTYVPPTHPYGSMPAPNDPVNYLVNYLETTRTFTPVSAARFRAEFVQYAAGPPHGGPRVIELDAISATGPVVSAIADSDGDGVTNGQEYTDGTQPNNASSRHGRITLVGPSALVTKFPERDTYAPGTAVTASGGSAGEIQFGGWTGSYRAPASFGFTMRGNASQAGDVVLKGLFGSMPVDTVSASPSFTNSNGTAADVSGFATSPDGRWIAFGNFDRVRVYSTNEPRPYVARFVYNGSLDPGLDAGFTPAPNNPVIDAAFLPDGKMILSGHFTQISGQPAPGVARFNADGTRDMSFAPPVAGASIFQVMEIEPQRDGKLLLAGNVWNGSAYQSLMRMNADGSIDSTFAPTPNSPPVVFTQQRDGKILMAGNFTQVNGTPTPKLVRLNLDGTLDSSFSLLVTLGVASVPSVVIEQPDGRILVGGAVQIKLNGTDVSVPVARLNADGTLDTAFTQKVHALAVNVAFNDMTRQTDGRIVGGGSFTRTSPDVVNLLRLNADGSADTNAFVISRPNAPVFAVASQVDGSLLVGGSFSNVAAGADAGNSHTYHFTSVKSGWRAAEAEAVRIGGHLVSISGPRENNFIVDTLLPLKGLTNFPVWTGFSDQGVEGIWAWASGEPAAYTNWNPSEPSNFGGEDHGMINWNWARNGSSRYTWDDTLDVGTSGLGGNSDGPYHGIIEVDPAVAAPTTNHWVAGRDLLANEQAGAVMELTNPNGTVPEWSYGTRATLTSGTLELNPFTSGEHYNSSDFEGWFRPPYTGVYVSTSNNHQAPWGVVRHGEMKLHPPSSGYTVVRWTAPAAGTYSVTAFWQDVDWNAGDGCNVSLVKNGTDVVFTFDYNDKNGAFTNQVMTLAGGDVLEFMLGTRGNDQADTARFNATVTQIQSASDVWVGGRDLAVNEKPDGHANETTNPNPTVPQWSYGHRSTLVTSGLNLYTNHSNTGLPGDDAMEGWKSGDSAVLSNTGTTPVTYDFGFGPNLSYNPHEMLISPGGHGGPFPVVRWTAPAAGRYELLAYWQDLDFHGGNGLSAHLVVNGGQIYAQDIDNGHGCSVAQSLDLKAGDQVDFTMGTRGQYDFDTTKFNVAIMRPASSTVPPVPSGTLSQATTRAEIGNDPAVINWASAGADNTDLAGNPLAIESSTGTAYLVRKNTTGAFNRRNQGTSWFGNFAPGDALLTHLNSDGPVIIEAANADGVFSAIGMQIQPNTPPGPFTATIRAYDRNGVLLGTFAAGSVGNGNGDNSAVFIGVKSTVENIHAISVDTDTSGFGGDFAINRVSIQSSSSGSGQVLSNPRLAFAQLVTTNHMAPFALDETTSLFSPIYAANAPAMMLVSVNEYGQPITFAELESSTDGQTFQRFSQGVYLAGSGTWSFPVPALPPGANYFRAAFTNTQRETVRTQAEGPLITPPVVTSVLTAQGEIGTPFTYTGTATGRLTGFSASSLPAWATAAFDANSNTLRITGTPNAGGDSSISLQPANAAGSTASTLVLSVLNPFANWRNAHFTAGELANPAISGPLGDATGAGIANLIKYALGIPPKLPGNAGMPTGDVEDYGASDYLTLVYTRDKSAQGVTFTVEVSGDMASWQSGPAFTTEVSRVSHPNNTETVTVRDNVAVSTGQKRFIRLKIVQ